MSERHPNLSMDFYEAAALIKPGEKYILSKNVVDLIDDQGVWCGSQRIRYEGLSYLSDVYPVIEDEDLVMGKLQPVAERLYDEGGPKPPENFPLLTVINDETDDTTSEVFDVARLVSVGRLPVFARPHPTRRGRSILRLGTDLLIRNMAGKVQVPSVGATLRLDVSAMSVQEGAPKVSISVPNGMVDAALLLLQLEAANVFKDHMFTANEYKSDQAKVALRVFPRPNLDEAMVSMIETVESWGGRVIYQNNQYDSGMYGPLLWATHSPRKNDVTLAHERTLDMAILNAYLMTQAYNQEDQ